MSEHHPKFTLRFQNSRTHELLGAVADEMGLSKNQLAERMLERELHGAALLLESHLVDTVELLRGYRHGEHLGRDIQEFAEAEAHERDPLRSRLAGASQTRDAYGIAEAFSS